MSPRFLISVVLLHALWGIEGVRRMIVDADPALGYMGYLTMSGMSSLNFRWSKDKDPDAIASVSPAAGLRAWEFKKPATVVKNGLGSTEDLYAGVALFLRSYARKKGVMVTLLQPKNPPKRWPVTIILYRKVEGNAGRGKVELVKVNTPFNIGSVDEVGVCDGESHKLDDLDGVTQDQGLFYKAVRYEAQGRVEVLSDLPALEEPEGTVDDVPKTPAPVLTAPAPKVFVPVKTGTYMGYLWNPSSAGRLSWGWLLEQPSDALMMVSMGSGVKKWELGKINSDFWRNVETESNMFNAFLSILKLARKKGVYVTLLQPVVKIFYFIGSESPVHMAKIGQGFNVGHAACTGIVSPGMEKVDDMDGMVVNDKSMFQNVIKQNGGTIFDYNLDIYDASTEQLNAPISQENVAEEDIVNDESVSTTAETEKYISDEEDKPTPTEPMTPGHKADRRSTGFASESEEEADEADEPEEDEDEDDEDISDEAEPATATTTSASVPLSSFARLLSKAKNGYKDDTTTPTTTPGSSVGDEQNTMSVDGPATCAGFLENPGCPLGYKAKAKSETITGFQWNICCDFDGVTGLSKQ